MKLGVFVTGAFKDFTLDEALNYVKDIGAEAVEFGTGNYPEPLFVKPDELLNDAGKRQLLLRQIESKGLFISGLSCQGNPLNPNQMIARQHHEVYIQTIALASKLGVPVVTCYSGTPGTPDGSQYPNFPSTYWPYEYLEIFNWQWEQRIIPYWKDVGRYAAQLGVRIAIEPFGGLSVHSPATLLKLRHAIGEVIGIGFDAANLWWQGIDPTAAIKILGDAGAIHHVSTKDIEFSRDNMNAYGVLDMRPFDQPRSRSWFWRTIGYGHSAKTWADIISALQLVGYNYAFNIEQEDPLIESLEGIKKAADFLKPLIIQTPYKV